MKGPAKSAAQLAGVTSDDVLERSDVLPDTEPPLRVPVGRVPCRLQESVTCGPVCLLMAADCLRPTHGVRCAALVAEAVSRGFSRHGELFSAEAMAALARDVFGLRSEVLRGDWDVQAVAERVASGAELALVPYDCDANFGPGQYGGERSHWALVVGAGGKDELVCVQPKSRRFGVWQAGQLRASNGQLHACRTKRDNSDLVVPERLDELRDRCVMVSFIDGP